MLSQKNETEIEIFFDEIEPEKNCDYLILGALFINTKDKDSIINKLLDYRCQNSKNNRWNTNYASCLNKENCKELYHKLNNSEIHFSAIRKNGASKSEITISKNWLNFFINDSRLRSVNFYINMDKLDTSFFGNENVKANIYNKFFRTIINYGLKCFFKSYDKIKIKNIFYDKKGELERHSFFNNFNFDKLKYETQENIELLGKIIFIDSDHKIEKNYSNESHLIQLIDLILGTIRQNIFYVSKDELKNEISRVIRPELNKLNKKYWSLKYLKISFFPKNKIKIVNDLENNETYERKDEFYSLEDLKLDMPSQAITLEKWF